MEKIGYSLLVFVLIVVGCTAPGKGPKAESGYQRAELVINALGLYLSAKGVYPDSLAQLVPDFGPTSILAVPDLKNERYPLEYKPEEDQKSYQLSFRYTGPGMNVCRFSSRERGWDCSGYY